MKSIVILFFTFLAFSFSSPFLRNWSYHIFRCHHHHLEALTPLYKTHPRAILINHRTWQCEATKPTKINSSPATLFIFPVNRQSDDRRHHLGFVAHHLGFQMPDFAHVSLLLAPDRSKLSKRHGATSVGQYREMGYLPQAMVNYLALLGWGDGTENEFFTLEKLGEKFTVGRVNKSGAIFDSTKFR
ncbi:hypothetical protein ACFX1S_034150 [Malus domestica]